MYPIAYVHISHYTIKTCVAISGSLINILSYFYFQPLYTMAKRTRFNILSPDREKARNVDRISRTIFPAVFIIFNFAYWLVYIFWEPDKTEV